MTADNQSLPPGVKVQVLPYLGKPQKQIDKEKAKREEKGWHTSGTAAYTVQPKIKEDWQE